MLMKKIIAIGLTLVYLCFLVGTLTPSGLDLIAYEKSVEGSGNEKNESENTKGVEVSHLLQATKNTSRIKAQRIVQSVERHKASAANFFHPHKQLISRNNFPVIDDPIFLKIKVFRL
jgi:hypothetical protein